MVRIVSIPTDMFMGVQPCSVCITKTLRQLRLPVAINLWVCVEYW